MYEYTVNGKQKYIQKLLEIFNYCLICWLYLSVNMKLTKDILPYY